MFKLCKIRNCKNSYSSLNEVLSCKGSKQEKVCPLRSTKWFTEKMVLLFFFYKVSEIENAIFLDSLYDTDVVHQFSKQ